MIKNTLITIAVAFALLAFFSQFSTRNVSSTNNQISQENTNATSPSTEKKDEPSLITSLIISWWWYISYYGFASVFGVFIYRDAKNNNNLALNIKPFWWGVITVLEPPVGLLAYWLIHYSKLKTKSHRCNENN
ncbi:MAG TPA: hypothetical protein ENJ08_05945 [Gammaproteobacteria bacterium]|nr:hypothetical protein [Gammaproteobacteria bacterium]